jgi:hypothetical protein
MIPLVILIFSSPLVIVAILTFDQLVIIEKERFPEQWKNDGSPATFFRQRNQFERGFRASFATNKYSLAWLFLTPRWVKEDEKAMGVLRRLRVLAVVWNFVAMPLFILSVLWTSSHQ